MRIPIAQKVICGVFVFLPFCALAQVPPAAPSGPASAIPAGPAAPLAPEARDILTMLHDRKDTLKDFTGKIDYSVENKIGDVSGKRGTAPDSVNFINDPTKGPTFSADFTVNTQDGKAKTLYHTQFIFDYPKNFTIKDFGVNNNVKQFMRSTVLPAGAKPGDAVTLKGPLTLPIGLDVKDVAETFEVTLQPSKDPNQALLRLIPREKGKFEYTQLEVTVDKRPDVQLPIKLVETASSGDITTIALTELKINGGTARLADANTPASEGWTERAGGSTGK